MCDEASLLRLFELAFSIINFDVFILKIFFASAREPSLLRCRGCPGMLLYLIKHPNVHGTPILTETR